MSRVVSWRAEDPEHLALQVGRRPVQALWPLLRPNFRQVFLEPQRRTGAGTVTWRWRGADPQPKPAAADLAVLRRRLGHALQDLSVELDHREGVVAGVGSWELHVSMEKLVSTLLQASDEGLSVYLVQTENGWRIRSWGFAVPASASVFDETAAEAANVDDEVAPEAGEIRSVPPKKTGGWAKWRWRAAAVFLLGGGVVWGLIAWVNQPKTEPEAKSVTYSVSESAVAASKLQVPKETLAQEPSNGAGAKSGAVGVSFVKPIRLELGSLDHAPETHTPGLVLGSKAGAAAVAALDSTEPPAASVGGMAAGLDAKGDRAGARTQAMTDDETEKQVEKDEKDSGSETPAEASVKGVKPSGQPAGGSPEQSPKPDAASERLNASAKKTTKQSADVPPAKPAEVKAEAEIRDTDVDGGSIKRPAPKFLPKREAAPHKSDVVQKAGAEEEAHRLVVVRRDATKAPDDEVTAAEGQKPKTSNTRGAKPELLGLSNEEPVAPDKPVLVTENAERKPRAGGTRSSGGEEAAEPDSPMPASAEVPRQKQIDGATQTTLETVVEPPAGTALAHAVRGTEPGQLAPGAETLTRVVAYRVADWQLRRVRDVVLPTAPREEGQPDTRAEALARAWEEARRRVPTGFNQPRVRSGWRFEVQQSKLEPEAGLVWTGDAGADGAVTRSNGRVWATWTWAGLLPGDQKLARLATVSGRELARLEFDLDARRVRVRLGEEVASAVPWFQIEKEDGGREDGLAEWSWQSLERFRWSDARWERDRVGGHLRVLCEAELPGGPALRSGTLGVVDARSGWALAVELRVE